MNGHVRQIRTFGAYFYGDYLYVHDQYPNDFHSHSQWEINAHGMGEQKLPTHIETLIDTY